MPLMCLVCAEAFEATRRDARYCSPRCRDRARRARRAALVVGTRSAAPFAEVVRTQLAKLPPAMQGHELGLLAQAVADRLDAAAPRDTAGLARELRATMADLRALADGAVQEADVVDDLLARRRRTQG